MRPFLFALFAAISLAQTVTKHKAAPPAPAKAPEISSKQLPEDAPRWKRKYSIKLTSKPGITLTLECEDSRYGGDRTCTGKLQQPDEKSASFYVGGIWGSPGESVAEHIFDPVLVPETKRLTTEMFRMDAAWRASNPTEFKDEHGTNWSRKQ